MEEKDGEIEFAERLEILKALIAELRGRLGNLTEQQSQDVGMWMLKARWLGEGKSAAEVFGIDPVEPPARFIKLVYVKVGEP